MTPEILWQNWRENRQENAAPLLEAFRPMINQEVSRQSGVLPRSYLETEAKRIVFDAFDVYDPAKNTRLSTHVANRLKGLGRVNYTYQNALRMPEERQRQYNTFMTARRVLEERLGRGPSIQELSQELQWPEDVAGRMEREAHVEYTDIRDTKYDEKDPDFSQDDAAVDYIYHSLLPEEKILFESVTGYKGHPVLSLGEIARQLGISEPQARRRKGKLIEKIDRMIQN